MWPGSILPIGTVTGGPADSARALGSQVSTNGIAVMTRPAPPITAVDAVRNLRRPLLMLSSAISFSTQQWSRPGDRTVLALVHPHTPNERPSGRTRCVLPAPKSCYFSVRLVSAQSDGV